MNLALEKQLALETLEAIINNRRDKILAEKDWRR